MLPIRRGYLSACRDAHSKLHRLRHISPPPQLLVIQTLEIHAYCRSTNRRAGASSKRFASTKSKDAAETHHSPEQSAIENIRNIGIIAHVDAGKTTTTERMLFHGGLTRHIGNVDHGDTVTDFLPMERDRGITIQSAAVTFHWPLKPRQSAPGEPPRTINLIDTPGHQDFRFEVDRCMPVLDGAVCIIDGVKGVEAHTERVWASAQQFRIPRIMYVNKLDRDGASFRRSVSDIATRLNAWPLVCQLPWWEKDQFVGIIDIVNMVGIRKKRTYSTDELWAVLRKENPDLAEEVERAHQALIEALFGHDDTLLSMDVNAKLLPQDVKRSIRKAIAKGNGRLVPVFAGSSIENIGVDLLLDAIVDFLPGADLRSPVVSLDNHRKSTLDTVLHNHGHGLIQPPRHRRGEPLSIAAVASVFKVAADFDSRDTAKQMLSFVRVYHGQVQRTAESWNSSRRTVEKPTGIVQISADKTHSISHLRTGEIGALTGLKYAKTGDTLIWLKHPKHMATEADPIMTLEVRPAEIPNPVAFITMAPGSHSGLKSLESALERLSREDPSLRYSYDDKTELFTLSGMGQLHLEVSLDRLKNVYKVAGATIYGIEVEYKECLLQETSPQRHVFDQVVNSRPGKAACTVSLAPLTPQGDLPADSIPAAAAEEGGMRRGFVQDENNLIDVYILEPEADGDWPAGFDPERVRHELLNGASAALRMGPRLRRPLHGCAVQVTYDPATDFFGPGTPSSHNVKAAYSAVKACLKDAHSRSQVGVLEPVMRVEISCPASAAAKIQHDITSARGGLVLEVNDERRSGNGNGSGSDGGSGGSAGGVDSGDSGSADGEGRIPLHEVFLPSDPYEFEQSLRASKKEPVRMLEIKAVVPLKEMLDYDSRLRSMTGGRHSLTMTLDTFERVIGPREKALA